MIKTEERFETFTVLISKISRNIRKIKNNEMSNYSLRSTHISCLYYLYKTEELTATELCERCEEDKATVSRTLDFLEKNGYLFCETKSAKRYKSPFVLTEKGLKTAKEIAEKIDRALETVSVGLSENERKEFYRCLRIISNNLEKLSEGEG